MGYYIKYDEITNFNFTLNQVSQQINEGMSAILASLDAIIQMETFKGNTADSMKSYMQEVSYTLLVSAVSVLNELNTQFLLYKDGYASIDDNLHVQIQEEKLTALLNFFIPSLGAFGEVDMAVRSAVNSVNDIVALPSPNPAFVEDSYSHTKTLITGLREDVGIYESTHASQDFTLFREMLSTLNGLIGDVASKEEGAVNYCSKDILSSPHAQKLGQCLQTYGEKQEALQGKIAAATERENQRFELLTAEWAKAREEQGWLKTVMATLEVVGGVFTIVAAIGSMAASAGATAPLAVPGIIAGFGMVVHGRSNLVEGIQDIYYGSKGDPYTVAINPLRDIAVAYIFGEKNKQKVWDVFGTGCVAVGAVSSLGASAWASGLQASAKVVSTCPQAVNGAFVKGAAEVVTKAGITMAAGAGSGYLGKQVALARGASETVSDIVGLLSGVAGASAAGVGMSKWKWSYEPGSKGIPDGVCFVAGTPVTTMAGLRAIEEIGVGDKVTATNPETGQMAEKEVVQTYIRESNLLVHLWLDEEEIQVTPTHPFYVEGKGWVNAVELTMELTMEDRLVDCNGGVVSIQALRYNTLEKPMEVYNLEVADFHTYYVSESRVLVHNADYEGTGAPKPGKTGKVGDFSNIEGSSIDDVLSRIPENATRRELDRLQ